MDIDIANIIALAISALSLFVAIRETYKSNKLAKEANDLAKQSLAASQKAATDARWFALQEAVHHLMGFDPTAEPVKDRLINLRIAMTALVDELEDWDGFDSWLEAENALGLALSQELMETARREAGTEERVTRLGPLMTWAQALSQNLRYLRSIGHDPEALSRLRAAAEGKVKDVYTRNNWGLPPAKNPRLQPLN